MKQVIIFAFIALTFLGSCKKNTSDGTNPSTNGTTCKVVKITQSVTNYPPSDWLFYYDNLHNLEYIKEIESTGDTIIYLSYNYLNNILQYSVNYQVESTDTTYYHYNPQNKLTETIEYIRYSSSVKIIKSTYFYNTANQIILYTLKEQINSIAGTFDSVLYTYTGNNVTTEDHYTKYGTGPFTCTKFNYSYDNKKNFYKSITLQPIAAFQWAENNMIQMKYADSTNAYLTRTFLTYNEFGYPTDYIEHYSSPVSTTIEYYLTFQCP